MQFCGNEMQKVPTQKQKMEVCASGEALSVEIPADY
jgi:hypothetical protein